MRSTGQESSTSFDNSKFASDLNRTKDQENNPNAGNATSREWTSFNQNSSHSSSSLLSKRCLCRFGCRGTKGSTTHGWPYGSSLLILIKFERQNLFSLVVFPFRASSSDLTSKLHLDNPMRFRHRRPLCYLLRVRKLLIMQCWFYGAVQLLR